MVLNVYYDANLKEEKNFNIKIHILFEYTSKLHI